MTQAQADRGSIWTVPSLNAMCVVISGVRGLGRGRPEYQVLPVYTPNLLNGQTALDFVVRASETRLAVALYVALWNTLPIFAADLGEQLGQLNAEALHELGDAYLSMMDPGIRVPDGRLGAAKVTADVQQWRDREVERWRGLAGRVMAAIHAPEIRREVVYNLSDAACIDFSNLNRHRLESDDALANLANITALGAGTALLSMEIVPASNLTSFHVTGPELSDLPLFHSLRQSGAIIDSMVTSMVGASVRFDVAEAYAQLITTQEMRAPAYHDAA